jgi:hypothetical protein
LQVWRRPLLLATRDGRTDTTARLTTSGNWEHHRALRFIPDGMAVSLMGEAAWQQE